MSKLGVMALILVLGAALLAPMVMFFEPEPMPGDFVIALNHQHLNVPVLWSLCASGALALFYGLLKQ